MHDIEEQRKKLEHDKQEFENTKKVKNDANYIRVSNELASVKAQIERDNELKGEILENMLEDYLNEWFKHNQDKIKPIAKGASGGDIIQEVIVGGKLINKIKFECKNTKTPPSPAIINKLRNDMISHAAIYGVIVTSSLPNDFKAPYKTLDEEKIYILDANEPNTVKMVVSMLRKLIEGSHNAVKNLPSAHKEAALTNWATSEQTSAYLRKHLQTIKADYDAIISDEKNYKSRIKGRKVRNNDLLDSLTEIFIPLTVIESTKDINLLEELDDEVEK